MTSGTSQRWLAAAGVAALVWLAPAAGAGQDPPPGDNPLDPLLPRVQSFVDVMQPVVQAAMRGHLQELDKPFAFVPKPSYIRGVDGRMYVPYTVTVGGGEIDSPTIEVYICVAARRAPGPASDPLAEGPECTFEDAYAADVTRAADDFGVSEPRLRFARRRLRRVRGDSGPGRRIGGSGGSVRRDGAAGRRRRARGGLELGDRMGRARQQRRHDPLREGTDHGAGLLGVGAPARGDSGRRPTGRRGADPGAADARAVHHRHLSHPAPPTR